ncbi:unnamed protein product [Rotaria magnacalcarata]|uniref:Uncharacterized protein n=1 Tax=Rotaria magnacalcarata TaxID=392030 RepID=A0A819MZI9_9BILA|nr:unnamed protein product [Rotaria magnacalcarata]CAF3988949.1 unnamed protein product [Rotaria magnacalcarata]
MSTSQSISELVEEKHGDKKKALQSINKLTEEEMTHIDQWLSILYNTYENLEYPLSHRVFQATTYFDDEQQLWYKQMNAEINNDWSCFL